MRTIKILALAAVLAAGTSTLGRAEGEVLDHVYNYGPISDTYTAANPATPYVHRTATPATTLQVPASPWIADRFNSNRNMTVEDKWFLRVEGPAQ